MKAGPKLKAATLALGLFAGEVLAGEPNAKEIITQKNTELYKQLGTEFKKQVNIIAPNFFQVPKDKKVNESCAFSINATKKIGTQDKDEKYNEPTVTYIGKKKWVATDINCSGEFDIIASKESIKTVSNEPNNFESRIENTSRETSDKIKYTCILTHEYSTPDKSGAIQTYNHAGITFGNCDINKSKNLSYKYDDQWKY